MPKRFKSTKRSLTALIICMFLSLNAFSIVLNANSVTTTTVLPTDGTIQEAINMANPGDTLRVAAGTYNENVIVNKSITLIGDGQHLTFLIGNGVTAVITVTANNVNISGFSVENGIQGVLLQGSNESTISNNKIASNIAQGVHLNSSYGNTLLNNKISLNGLEGIFLQDSYDNLVNGNVVTNNKYVGINIRDSNSNRINNNTITFHKNQTLHAQGILSVSSNNTIIEGNIILNNAYGLDAYESVNNTVYSNIISNNYQGVDLSESSNNNTFYHNDFVNNTKQVSSYLSSNTWDNGYPSGGNYWSDYTGIDANGDGIGDTSYDIDANNQDRYPLKNPWRPVYDVTAPITTDDYDGLWHTTDFTITLTASDDSSGVAETYYKINDGPIQNISADGQPRITKEGANNTLEYWSEDKAGNEEDPTNNLKEIKLDKNAPIVSILSPTNGSVIRSPEVTVQWNGTDAGAGIDHYEVRLDGGSWISKGTEQNHSFTGLSDGTHRVDVKAVDKLGQSQETSVNFTVNTSPTGGSGYLEEAALALIVALSIGIIALYVFKIRKRAKVQKGVVHLSS